MMINKIAVCPICGKRTYLRIQNGGYLSEYPIRVICKNCRALIKGVYLMPQESIYGELHLLNAQIEECDFDQSTKTVKNADYLAEVSGELPCDIITENNGPIPTSPFLRAADNLLSAEGRIERLTYFEKNMSDWRRRKSTAFQLLDEGSIEYIASAIGNKMGEYYYECTDYLKSLQCLQEIVQEETKYLFWDYPQDEIISSLLQDLSQIDHEQLHLFAENIGGIQGLIQSYRKAIEVFSNFMLVYPNLLPAETYCYLKDREKASTGIATCSFGDIKTFYQDAYESLLSLLYFPVCLDNMSLRGSFESFSRDYDDVYCKKTRNLIWYRGLDNGTRINKLNTNEHYQNKVGITANRLLRNGIGHNNIKFDGITQKITAYDLKKHDKVVLDISLMDMAIDCLGLARSAIIFSEIILFVLRHEFRGQGIKSIIHPRFYKDAETNGKCPCGSNMKYKKCCRNDVEQILRN